jgi:hypothetical protein
VITTEGTPALPFSSPAAEQTFKTLLDGVCQLQKARVLCTGDPLLLMNVFWAFTHGIAVLALDNHLKHSDVSQVFNAGFDALLKAYAYAEKKN